MANYRSTVLNTGSVALLQALGNGKRIPVGRFRVGSAYDFIPDKDSTAPVGTLLEPGVFTDKIGLSFVDKDQLRVDLSFTEDMGDYFIGNVVIDLLVEDEYVPFLMWVSDIAIPKYKFNVDTGKIGNRYVFSFTEKLQNIDEALNITVLPVVHASLPQYTDETSLPPASIALFQNGVLQTYGTLFRPVTYVRRSVDENYFGYASLDRLDNPFFGVFDEGIVGSPDVPYTGKFLWGGYFESTDFDEPISGGSFTTKENEFGDSLVGDPF